MSEPTDEARYVYGVVRARDFETASGGALGPDVGTIGFEDIAAVVSPAPPLPVKATRANLLRHSDVLQEALKASTVLPMSFGVVMPDDESVVEELLKPAYRELAATLDEMDGKVEIDLKGFYREDVVLREIVAENPQVAKLRGATLKASKDASYYGRIELGRTVATALAKKRDADAQRIVSGLRPFAVEYVNESELPERVALSAAFLVDRERLEDFDGAVEELAADVRERMQLKCVGPLPPYRFVDLRLMPTGRGA